MWGPPSPEAPAFPVLRVAGAASLSFVVIMASLLIFNHFGRPFEKVLIGYRIPAVICWLGIAVAVFSGSLKQLNTRVGRAFVALMLWMTVASVFSTWRGGSVSYVLWYLSLWGPLLLLVAYAPKTIKQLKILIYVMAASCCFHIILGGGSGLGTGSSGGERLDFKGTYGNADDVSMLAGVALPLVIFWSMQLTPVLKAFGLMSAAGFLLYIIGLTGTRAAVLGLAGMFCTYLIRSNVYQRIAIVVGSLVSVLVLVIALPSSVLQRFETIVDSLNSTTVQEQQGESEAMASTAERRDLLRDAIKMISDHPLFGVGPGEFSNYRHTHLTYPNGQYKRWAPSHNTYAQIASESGPLGLITYVILLGSIYLTIRSARKLNSPGSHPEWQTGYSIAVSLEAMFVYFVICAAFLTCDRHPHQFVLAGMALALERLSRYLTQRAQPVEQPGRPAAASIVAGGPLFRPRQPLIQQRGSFPQRRSSST